MQGSTVLSPKVVQSDFEASAARAKQRARWRRRGSNLLAHVVLLVGAIIMLVPLAWMLSTAFKPREQIWVYPPVWIPNPIAYWNFSEAMEVLPVSFLRVVANTLFVTVFATMGTVFSATLAAYAFARLRFWGREVLFSMVLATMMLPGVVTLIPTFLIFRYLRWLDTFAPLIVPFWLGTSAFSIFLLRQFFLGLPRELDEAAKMDGASNLNVLLNVIVPLAKPALATVVIFQILWRWNDFMEPMIYLNSMDKYTIALVLRTFQNVRSQEVQYLMALSSLQVAPVILLFFLAQRYFIRGIQLTGLAGR
jgi:multiple sugar transport system permease protein